jgi:TonB family protein
MASVLIGITILLGAAYLAASALRHSSAALRHAIWTCAIAATLLLAPLRWRAPRRTINQPLPAAFTTTFIADAERSSTGPTRAGSAPSFADIALSLWALGSALIAIRFFAGAAQFRRIVRKAKAVESACPIPIRTSPHIPGPLVTGILRPVILLPEDAHTWAPARRRAVLAHELAHVRRRDPLILLAAHLATTIYWFHPMCWLAAARLRAESERACDDAALRIGLRPSSYAGHLLDLARMFNPQPAIPMATTSHLESRVKTILDPFVNRSLAARRTWLVAALATAAVMAPLTVFSLHAQQAAGSGTITGTVIDPTGATVPRAQVTATNVSGNNKEVATAGVVGTFAFSNIPIGNYSLEVRVPGFAVARIDNLILANGGTLNVPARLSVGPVSENIQVVAPGTPERRAVRASSGPIRIGGNVQLAKLLQQVNPIYPADLQAQGIEGTVLLSAIVSKDGTPASLTAQNTVNPEFVNAAKDAVSQWRYQPTLLNGEPVEVLTTITIEFKLRQQ